MITAKTTIERQATEAAGQGLSLDDACPYPFGSPAADHFKAIYTLALPLASEVSAARHAQPATTCHPSRCNRCSQKACA